MVIGPSRRGLATSQSCGDDRQKGGVRVALFGILKMVRQVRVEGHAVTLVQHIPLSIAHEDDRATLDEGRLAAAWLV
jgi:hypothetical protein